MVLADFAKPVAREIYMHLVRKNGLTVGPERVESRKSLVGAAWAGLLRFRSGLRGNVRAGRKQMRVLLTLPIGGNKRLMLATCASERFLAGRGAGGMQAIGRARLALVGAREVCESANPGRLGDGIGRAFVTGS